MTNAGVDPERCADLVARARREVDDGPLPSCQLAVARDGRVVVFETIGAAAPMSRYVTFSVTKALVAAAAWLLIGDGLLDPTAPVAEAISEFAALGKGAVTLEHLLTHTAGFPRAPLGSPAWSTRQRRLEAFARWRLDWEPGTRCEYHPSSAHWVVAELIERAAGIDYRVFVRERLIEQLGLPSLQLGVPEPDQGDVNALVPVGVPPPAAELAELGFPAVDLGEVNDATLLRFNDPETLALGVPGAGAVGTAADIAVFYQALLGAIDGPWDPAVLADGTRHIRVTLPEPTVGGPANRTLGLIVAGDDGLAVRRGFGRTCSPRAFGHSGAGGQLAWADPASGLSFCFLTNGLDANLIREGRRRAALGNRAGGLVEMASAT